MAAAPRRNPSPLGLLGLLGPALATVAALWLVLSAMGHRGADLASPVTWGWALFAAALLLGTVAVPLVALAIGRQIWRRIAIGSPHPGPSWHLVAVWSLLTLVLALLLGLRT